MPFMAFHRLTSFETPKTLALPSHKSNSYTRRWAKRLSRILNAHLLVKILQLNVKGLLVDSINVSETATR